jgi:hypothetical protein
MQLTTCNIRCVDDDNENDKTRLVVESAARNLQNNAVWDWIHIIRKTIAGPIDEILLRAYCNHRCGIFYGDNIPENSLLNSLSWFKDYKHGGDGNCIGIYDKFDSVKNYTSGNDAKKLISVLIHNYYFVVLAASPYMCEF